MTFFILLFSIYWPVSIANNYLVFGYCLLLKIENWKHCSKIIFKCMNSTVGLSFKVVFAEKVLTGPVNSARDPVKNVGHNWKIISALSKRSLNRFKHHIKVMLKKNSFLYAVLHSFMKIINLLDQCGCNFQRYHR